MCVTFKIFTLYFMRNIIYIICVCNFIYIHIYMYIKLNILFNNFCFKIASKFLKLYNNNITFISF